VSQKVRFGVFVEVIGLALLISSPNVESKAKQKQTQKQAQQSKANSKAKAKSKQSKHKTKTTTKRCKTKTKQSKAKLNQSKAMQSKTKTTQKETQKQHQNKAKQKETQKRNQSKTQAMQHKTKQNAANKTGRFSETGPGQTNQNETMQSKAQHNNKAKQIMQNRAKPSKQSKASATINAFPVHHKTRDTPSGNAKLRRGNAEVRRCSVYLCTAAPTRVSHPRYRLAQFLRRSRGPARPPRFTDLRGLPTSRGMPWGLAPSLATPIRCPARFAGSTVQLVRFGRIRTVRSRSGWAGVPSGCGSTFAGVRFGPGSDFGGVRSAGVQSGRGSGLLRFVWAEVRLGRGT
jgi:hypothetical protein